MKIKLLTAALSVILLCGATYLVAEGIYSIVLWDGMDGSLAYKTYDRVAGSSDRYGPSVASVEEPPADLPVFRRLATRAMVEALLPQFAKAGIAMGDVPREFNQENLERVAVTSKSPEGCHIIEAQSAQDDDSAAQQRVQAPVAADRCSSTMTRR